MFKFLMGVAFGAAGYWAWQSFGRDLLGLGSDQDSYGTYGSTSSSFNNSASTSSSSYGSSSGSTGSSTIGASAAPPTEGTPSA